MVHIEMLGQGSSSRLLEILPVTQSYFGLAFSPGEHSKQLRVLICFLQISLICDSWFSPTTSVFGAIADWGRLLLWKNTHHRLCLEIRKQSTYALLLRTHTFYQFPLMTYTFHLYCGSGHRGLLILSEFGILFLSLSLLGEFLQTLCHQKSYVFLSLIFLPCKHDAPRYRFGDVILHCVLWSS